MLSQFLLVLHPDAALERQVITDPEMQQHLNHTTDRNELGTLFNEQTGLAERLERPCPETSPQSLEICRGRQRKVLYISRPW